MFRREVSDEKEKGVMMRRKRKERKRKERGGRLLSRNLEMNSEFFNATEGSVCV